MRTECRRKRNARWSDTLAFRVGRTEGNARRRRDVQHRRYRNGKLSMRTHHSAATLRKSRNNALRIAEIIEKNCGGHDVHNRIDCSDLMEMDFAYRLSVSLGLRLRHIPERLFRQSSGAVAHLAPVDYRLHVGKVAVFVRTVMAAMMFMSMVMTVSMMMAMPVIVVVPVRQYHIEIRTCNPIGRLLRHRIGKLVPESEGIEDAFQLFGTRAKGKKRADRHVS